MTVFDKTPSSKSQDHDQIELQAVIDRILQQDDDLRMRLESQEEVHEKDSSVRFFDVNSTIGGSRRSTIIVARDSHYSHAQPDLGQIITTGQRPSKADPVSRFSWDFETTLEKSHVYGRITSGREIDVSVAASSCRESAWSRLSQFTLDDISVVSLYRLPITLDEIDKFAELTFGSFLKRYQSQASINTLLKGSLLPPDDRMASTAQGPSQGPMGTIAMDHSQPLGPERQEMSNHESSQVGPASSSQRIYRQRRAEKRSKARGLTVTVLRGAQAEGVAIERCFK